MSTRQPVRAEAGSVGSNPVRLDEEEAAWIVEALNRDLADASTLYHQLHKHQWNVEGAEHLGIHEFLREASEEVEEAADGIAERLQALGGVPHAGMATLAENATVEPEGEDVYDVRTSLTNGLEMYGDVIESHREHVGLAAGIGDHAAAHMLREQLVELEAHARVVDHFLGDDTLVQG